MSTPDLSRAHWRKSSHSSANGACIEVATIRAAIAVRDSKDPDGPRLAFTGEDWDEFTGQIKGGRVHLA